MTRIEQIEKLRKNCPLQFLALLNKALELAEKSFEERTRPSGDKYINHSLDVALSLQEKNF
ncbi:MAG: hypothetical protein XD93_0900, partial [candidate division WS6 bacterium 34_10]